MGKIKLLNLLLVLALSLFPIGRSEAQDATKFSFESIMSLDDMTSFLRERFQLGSQRQDLRHVFLDEGQATLKIRADDPSVEKYIYDIDLCQYYIWRWNISVDFDLNNKLRQAYVNGNLVFAGGNPKKIVPKIGKPITIQGPFRAGLWRPSPCFALG